jgi:hypothetical protein
MHTSESLASLASNASYASSGDVDDPPKRPRRKSAKRTVSVDLGLMSMAELQEQQGGPIKNNKSQVQSIEEIVAAHRGKKGRCPQISIEEGKSQTRWFLDHASIKITVSRDKRNIITSH